MTAAPSEPLRTLYPPIEPSEHGMLPVGDGHGYCYGGAAVVIA